MAKKDDFPLPEAPRPSGMLYLSSRFAAASWAASIMFAGKPKKGTKKPYISHLLGTCSIALENGADEDQAIAALLHDAIEDIEPVEEARAAVARFGPEVLRIVEECSDSDTHPKPPWKDRKKAYIERLKTADPAVLLVSASDKLHNIRSIFNDLRQEGSKVWGRFHMDREGELWYYGELVRIFLDRLPGDLSLVKELKVAWDDLLKWPADS